MNNNMNNDFKTKKNLFGILAIISALLFVSPVDLMTGLQVDDIGYFLTTIVTTVLNLKAAQDMKNVQKTANFTDV
ncbi:MAG: hypothetical protein II473_02975 [Clostridia bacterium]|nr:hypothetical protein [Clostridia bacterium]MBQ1895964.1 hypothetical protein [Clostridia bacterium]MBQ2092134.1 hypothetical protein [Clostridia bacterium]